MNKLFKIIRVITVAPIAALITIILLFCFKQGFFVNIVRFAAAVLTLTVLPLSAYPVSLIKPKNERRSFQRSLAIVFAVAGYIIGTAYSFLSKCSSGEKVLYLTYLLSGVVIAANSFIFKRKSSGHACGISGPVTLLVYYLSPAYALGYLLLIPVFIASVKMKRHTPHQFISGSIIPILCFLAAVTVI